MPLLQTSSAVALLHIVPYMLSSRARRLGERDKQLPPDHDWKDGATPMPRGYTWKWVETWKMALTLRDFLDIARYELKFFLAPRVEFVLLPIVKDFCDRFTPVVEDPLSERPPTDQEQVQVPPLPHQTSSSFFRRPSAYSLRLVGPSPFSAPSSVPLSTKEHQMLLCLAAHAISDPSPPRSRPELVRAYQKARILMKEFNSAVSDSEIAQHDHVSMLNLFRWIEEQREFFRNLALTLGLWEDSQRPWSAIDEFMSGTEIEDRVLYGQVGEWAFNLSCETFIILTYQEPVRWFLSKWEQSGCREIEEQEWRDAVTQTRSQFKTV
ncbi:hypothetical protein BT96DRAFT_85578 [Gymnopus androsaceus JB14]|uniref:Uncharacterized protein n=1 Tax=Gymnopus androsaceus JB14 TaxID=1447944 RepID=A0A6A4IGR6_9AGAR|nr:hypothetical protein BT96DRAFT_85578 [Gymnopus androsaceus JB14]